MRATTSLCALLLTLGLSACGGKNDSSPDMDQTTPSTTTSPSEPTTPPTTASPEAGGMSDPSMPPSGDTGANTTDPSMPPSGDPAQQGATPPPSTP